jgi:hypothetical protein
MTPIGAQAPIGTARQAAFSFNDLTSVCSLGHNIRLFARRVQQRLRSFPNRTLRYWEVRRASGGDRRGFRFLGFSALCVGRGEIGLSSAAVIAALDSWR